MVYLPGVGIPFDGSDDVPEHGAHVPSRAVGGTRPVAVRPTCGGAPACGDIRRRPAPIPRRRQSAVSGRPNRSCASPRVNGCCGTDHAPVVQPSRSVPQVLGGRSAARKDHGRDQKGDRTDDGHRPDDAQVSLEGTRSGELGVHRDRTKQKCCGREEEQYKRSHRYLSIHLRTFAIGIAACGHRVPLRMGTVARRRGVGCPILAGVHSLFSSNHGGHTRLRWTA